MTNNQKSGDDSTNLQAGRDIVLNTGNSIALYSIEEVAKQLICSVFGELPEETKKQIETNQNSYFLTLSDNLGKLVKQSEDIKKVIDSPDFQYISKTASISASRSSSIELHKNLSSLIAHRINNNDDDLKKIVYDEAISTIGKLTTDQLKIITLCYLLKYTANRKILSWETYAKYLATHIQPFIDFKNTAAEFQHIEYSGCGSIGIGSWNVVNIHKQEYAFLFSNPIEKECIDNLVVIDDIKKKIVVLDPKENKYFIKFKNKTEFENYLKEKNLDNETITKLMSIYESHTMNDAEVKNKIVKETTIGGEIFKIFETSNIQHLSLTSVGIAIGASYFEQITGEKINIDNWIN